MTAKASVTVMADKIPEDVVREAASRFGGEVERAENGVGLPINAWEVVFIRESELAAQSVMEQFAEYAKELMPYHLERER